MPEVPFCFHHFDSGFCAPNRRRLHLCQEVLGGLLYTRFPEGARYAHCASSLSDFHPVRIVKL
jgi:hypothetical protein